ncbi:hypothetical protein [Streptomyces sp. NPDC046985]|uniref:hypothetical protein n=1 Tax=Streptomyces sp. NPDC046985 TaxID=3155377 RepID=UPI003406443E
MDRLMNALSRLDWTCVETAERQSRTALDELCRPGPLRDLLAGVLTDERLLGLSERHSWGDRLVLWDDPVNQWRIRLHRFEDRADEPHSHRWPFHTLVLHGSYHHALYGPERWVRSVMENGGSLPRPSVVRTEGAGSSYAIDDEMVHYVKTEADTFSVIVQGPRLKERALRIRDGAVVWQEGRASQSEGQTRSVLTTSDRVEEIAELAHRVGLLDSSRL